jgi:MFS transporter, DHA1 family, multidrug resistance protein
VPNWARGGVHDSSERVMAEQDSSFPAVESDGRQRRIVLLGLTASSSLGLAASTIYVPAIPTIAHALNTSIARVQLTFVGYLLAFALGMLAWGPISDRLGRRTTLICGLIAGAVASLVCAVSPTIELLIAGRVLQGFGTCAGIVVGRAITRDLWGTEGAARAIAGLGIAATLTQASAPVLGGYVTTGVGWRANFVIIAVFACLAVLLILCTVPGRIAAAADRGSARSVFTAYSQLFGTRRFVGYALAAAGAHAGFHVFAAGAPAILIGRYGLSPEQYGYWAGLPPLGFIVGSLIAKRLTGRHGINGAIRIGAALLVPAGLLMLALAVCHVVAPWAVVAPMVFVCCGSGLITPNAAAGCLGVYPRMAGAASGLLSFVQMIGAAAATAALSLGPSGSQQVLALVVALLGTFCIGSFGSLLQPWRAPGKAAARAPGKATA